MTVEELKKIEELYALEDRSFKPRRSEIQIIEDFRKRRNWETASDQEKLEIRNKELMLKHVYKQLYSDLVTSYEESVIELTKLIIKFLEEVSLVVFDHQNISEEDFILFRLKNMLYIELFALNKHLKLKFYTGHILFETTTEPILIEIEKTSFYTQYKLQDLKNAFENVRDILKKEPYKE